MANRWPLSMGAFFLLLLLLLVIPSFCTRMDAGTSVVGVVVADDGEPIDGAKAYLRAPTRIRSTDSFLADSTVTDSRGCLHLSSLHNPGTVEISVLQEGFKPFTATASYGDLAMNVVLLRTQSPESSRGQVRTASAGDSIHSQCGDEGVES